MTYLITYDLSKPGQNYPGLIAALRNAGAVQILYSTWLVSTQQTNVQLRTALLSHMDANDRLFVTGVNQWAYSNIMHQTEAERILQG